MTIQRGFAAIKEAQNSSAMNLKLKNGESAVIRFLQQPEEIISVWEYTFQVGEKWHTVTAIDKDSDPLYAAGHKASFKTYLLVLDKTDNKVKIFKASKTVGKQLLGLMDEYGSINDRDFKITRNGDKLETTYQFFPRDKEAFDVSAYEDQMPNIEEMVRPLTKEAILAIMHGGGEVKETNAPKQESTEDFPF